MLSPKTMEIIKQTAPILMNQGQEITTYFYKTMLSEHPELLNIFNIAHQREGRQQRALAEALLAVAMYVDNLEVIRPAVLRIAHKHRSIGVLPEHYPIVGKYLLAAMQKILGSNLTPEIKAAWEEAYQVIADLFITIESEMYEAAEKQPGGWRDWREFVVWKKEKESSVITSFYLKPKDGKPIASYLPGQYISIKAHVPGQPYEQIRQYSLSDAPGKEYYRISVKREEHGLISRYLHDQIEVGDSVWISAPAGDFFLNPETKDPIVLISGGVGLTPLLSMLNSLAERGATQDIYFIHAAINGQVHAMDKHLQQLAKQHENVRYCVIYEKPSAEDRMHPHFAKEGYIDQTWLESVIPGKEAEYYFCGPDPFMKAVKNVLTNLGVSNDRIHYEFFTSAIAI